MSNFNAMPGQLSHLKNFKIILKNAFNACKELHDILRAYVRLIYDETVLLCTKATWGYKQVLNKSLLTQKWAQKFHVIM